MMADQGLAVSVALEAKEIALQTQQKMREALGAIAVSVAEAQAALDWAEACGSVTASIQAAEVEVERVAENTKLLKQLQADCQKIDRAATRLVSSVQALRTAARLVSSLRALRPLYTVFDDARILELVLEDYRKETGA